MASFSTNRSRWGGGRERERERERERALGQNNFCRLYLRARTIARRTMMILEHARHARFASIKSTCYTPTSSCTLRRLRRPIRRKVESSRLNRRIIVILLLLRREIHKIEKPRKIARGWASSAIIDGWNFREWKFTPTWNVRRRGDALASIANVRPRDARGRALNNRATVRANEAQRTRGEVCAYRVLLLFLVEIRHVKGAFRNRSIPIPRNPAASIPTASRENLGIGRVLVHSRATRDKFRADVKRWVSDRSRGRGRGRGRARAPVNVDETRDERRTWLWWSWARVDFGRHAFDRSDRVAVIRARQSV